MRSCASAVKPAPESYEAGEGGFRTAEGGFVDLGKPLAILGVILAAIIGLGVLTAASPGLFSGLGNMTATIATTDFGDDTANSIRGPFVTLLAIGGLIGIVSLALLMLKFRKD